MKNAIFLRNRTISPIETCLFLVLAIVINVSPLAARNKKKKPPSDQKNSFLYKTVTRVVDITKDNCNFNLLRLADSSGKECSLGAAIFTGIGQKAIHTFGSMSVQDTTKESDSLLAILGPESPLWNNASSITLGLVLVEDWSLAMDVKDNTCKLIVRIQWEAPFLSKPSDTAEKNLLNRPVPIVWLNHQELRKFLFRYTIKDCRDPGIRMDASEFFESRKFSSKIIDIKSINNPVEPLFTAEFLRFADDIINKK